LAALEIAESELVAEAEREKFTAEEELRASTSVESRNQAWATAQVRLAREGRKIEDLIDQAELLAVLSEAEEGA
jgi:hypothetical protein